MAEPSEDDVIQVIEITGLDLNGDRDLAIQALKSNNGSLADVINEYFNDADGFRRKYSMQWDETMFSSEKDGSYPDSANSFFVEEAENVHNEVTYGVEQRPEDRLGAPSRPPSRTSNRSPMGRAAQWTAANPGAAPRSHAQEEEEMQRALRESAQEAGVEMPEQEAGVTELPTAAPYFGPANRDAYDVAQWAMVHSSEVERVPAEPNPPPSARKRQAGAPAFLVQGPSDFGPHRLGTYLTVLHAIPLARNLMLQSGPSVASYGHNSQWWKGQQIIPPSVLARMSTTDAETPLNPEEPNFEEELHRLMAFLDSTERSFGTISVLACTIGVLAHGTPLFSSEIERSLLQQIDTRKKSESNPFYSILDIVSVQSGEHREHHRICVLEAPVFPNEFLAVHTLYELLDHIIWGEMVDGIKSPQEAAMAVFRDIGDILTIKTTSEGLVDPIEIPEEFYPERWLASRKDEAVRIQIALKESQRLLTNLNNAQKELNAFYDVETQRTYDKRKLFERAQGRFDHFRKYLESRGRFRTVEDSGFDLDKHPDYHGAPPEMTDEEETLLKKLHEASDHAARLLEHDRSSLEELQAEAEQVKAKQRFLGRLLTKPGKPGRPNPMTCKKYLLQGIVISPDVVYVCKRSKADLIEVDDEPKTADQWWRLAYTHENEAEPVKAEPLDFSQVHERAWQDTRTPLLIYASEQAVYADPVPLSTSLERFIKADNKAFQQELRQEQAGLSYEQDPEVTTPPPKRKHREDSMDSMATNRVSAGSQGDKTDLELSVENDNNDGPEFVRSPKRTYGESSSDDMNLDVSDEAPPVPQRGPLSTENTSSSPTPTTLAQGDGESRTSRETQQTTPAESTGESVIEETKAPEMQERFQMPTLSRFHASENFDTKPSKQGDMDMADGP